MAKRNRVSQAASILGKKARGIPKNFSDFDRLRLRERLAELRKKRWPKK
jgi:hypothetical protein